MLTLRKISIIMLLLLFSNLAFLVPMTNAVPSSKDSLQVFSDGNGIRIVVEDIELYFNATNGGEITEYFDLTVDPYRARNLVNLGWKPYYNLLPLFASLFYLAPFPLSEPYKLLSTGGDAGAKLWLIEKTSEYAILQSSARVMDRFGGIARDAYGNVIYVKSTWIIRSSGLVSVERTFFVPNYATVPSGWRWYPFKTFRRAGFDYDATFYMFNTTYAYTSVVNRATYKNEFGSFSLLPKDSSFVFGVATPFSDKSIGGDGTHNILIAYKYDELLNVNEWRTDNYQTEIIDITESGAVHQFNKAFNVFTHTYHMLINFTHQSINKEIVQDFARYYADDTSIASLMKCSITTNKDVYKTGDHYAFYGSGISYYDLTGTTARLTVKNSANRIVLQKNYGPGDIMAGQTFNATLLRGTTTPNPDEYTLLLQIFSSVGIEIASGKKVITVATP